eukprot:633048-Hanusia_phi.AAC.2
MTDRPEDNDSLTCLPPFLTLPSSPHAFLPPTSLVSPPSSVDIRLERFVQTPACRCVVPRLHLAECQQEAVLAGAPADRRVKVAGALEDDGDVEDGRDLRVHRSQPRDSCPSSSVGGGSKGDRGNEKSWGGGERNEEGGWGWGDVYLEEKKIKNTCSPPFWLYKYATSETEKSPT